MDSLGDRIPSWAVPECEGQLVAKSVYKYSAGAACPRVARVLAEGGSRAITSSVLRPRVIRIVGWARLAVELCLDCGRGRGRGRRSD